METQCPLAGRLCVSTDLHHHDGHRFTVVATVVVLNGWAGVSEEQQEGFRVARQKAGKNADIWLCSGRGGPCVWWGWKPAAHYNPDGAGVKHLPETCYKPDRLGVDYVVVARSSLNRH